MNDEMVNYLALQKTNYEKGLVLKTDVLMWLPATNDRELEEAKQQVEDWK